VLQAERELERWKAHVNGQYAAQALRLLDRFVGGIARPVERATEIRLGEAVRLYGAQVEPRMAAAGDAVEVVLDFEVLEPPGEGWQLFLHVLGPDGRRVNADHVPVGGSHPVSEWKAGEFVRDRHVVRIPADWRSGMARVVVGLWNESGPKGAGKRALPTGTGAEIDAERRVVAGTVMILPRELR
jgi:hypothetical protein